MGSSGSYLGDRNTGENPTGYFFEIKTKVLSTSNQGAIWLVPYSFAWLLMWFGESKSQHFFAIVLKSININWFHRVIHVTYEAVTVSVANLLQFISTRYSDWIAIKCFITTRKLPLVFTTPYSGSVCDIEFQVAHKVLISQISEFIGNHIWFWFPSS